MRFCWLNTTKKTRRTINSQFWGKKSKGNGCFIKARQKKHAELLFSGCRTRLRRDKSVSAFPVALVLDRSGTRRLSGTIDSPRFLGLRSDGSDQTRGRV